MECTITRPGTRLSSNEAHKGLRGALGPSLVPGREGVLGHHPANRGVPKCTHNRVKKSVSELVDHTLYIEILIKVQMFSFYLD
jgi:hypothetical protein